MGLNAFPFTVFKIMNIFIVQEYRHQLETKHSILAKMTETVSKLTSGQDSPEHAEIDHLSCTWLELCHQAKKLQMQREEDLQRSNDYYECIGAVEALFEQVSKEWDSLSRYVSTFIGCGFANNLLTMFH